MKHIKQPFGSSICGQCCLAMITGEEVSTVIRMLKKSGCTNTKDLKKFLKKYGFRTSPKLIRLNSKQLIDNLTGLNIIVCHYFTSTRTHWIIKYDDFIFDPLQESEMSLDNWWNTVGGSTYPTSYLKIK